MRDERLKLVLPAIVISILGIMNTYSVSHTYSTAWIKQIVWFVISLTVCFIISRLDYVELYKRARLIYLFGFLLLLMVFVAGKESGGAKRWLSFRVMNLQPVEIMKIALVIVLAKYIEDRWKEGGLEMRDLLNPLFFIGLPSLLVLLQPDLGSAGVLLLTGGMLTLVAGVNRRSIKYITAGVIVLLPVLWFFVMKDYQRERVLTFIDPSRDPWGKGYQIIQSKIAIGSGGLFGKGFLHGTQSRLRFLPAPHTDFAFAVWCEEWGLIGAVVLISLTLWLIINLLFLATVPRRRFGAYMVIGFALIITIQMIINVYMVSGMFPVVGVPYPFFSYGGSSLFSLFLLLGISMTVLRDKRRMME